MENKQFISQYSIALCSVDGDEWFEISEILALCAINDHYAIQNLDGVLNKYNKGHIIPVEYVLYKIKETRN